MASSVANADLVRDQVSSISTCTPATVVLVNELLLPKPIVTNSVAPLATKKPSKVNAKPIPPKARTKNTAEKGNGGVCDDQLSPKQRSILATEIINATLKSLTEAIRTNSQGVAVRKQASSKDLVKAAARKTLRRSTSLPQTPLQPRSLSRVASSPDISTRHSRSSSTSSSTFSVHKSTAECARAAFACLRSLQVAKALETPIPPLQLENGMSVLIGKLLSLGLDDLALKELRLLKKRLLPETGTKRVIKSTTASPPLPATFPELLDFGGGVFSGAKLALVITTQLQTLRILGTSRKYSQVTASLPLLKPNHVSSPVHFLKLATEGITDKKQAEKFARQYQSLSETLLSLCPSVSSADDAVAKEPKLSVSPEIALQIQSIGLETRVSWWRLAGHHGDVAKDILDPLLRCLSAFSRRSALSPTEIYDIATATVDHVVSTANRYSKLPEDEHTSLHDVYRLLASIAKDAGMFPEAISWTTKYGDVSGRTACSGAQQCAYIARLLSLKLKQSTRDVDEADLLTKLLDELENPFKGTSNDIDDMMAEITSARRAANGILSKSQGSSVQDASTGLRELCESLVFRCPRLLLRYLGAVPDSNATTKDIVRYSQRIQLITMSALHTIDSVLFLLRGMSTEDRTPWDLLDSRLQECLVLYGRLEATLEGGILENGQTPPLYHVKISNLYYTYYMNMRRNSSDNKEAHAQQVRALRRSVECVRGRSCHEKKSACLCVKLQRMGDSCKQSGRYDEMLETLVTLRDELVEQGHLSSVAESATTMPLLSAWELNEETATLGHVTQAIIKSFLKYSKSGTNCPTTALSWSAAEQAVVLENLLVVLSQVTDPKTTTILQEVSQRLLAIYNVQSHPYRRLRILQQIYILEQDQGMSLVEDIESQLTALCINNVALEDTQDAGLINYQVNMQWVARTHREIRQETPELTILKEAVTYWVKLKSSCESLASLEAKVESIASLITHLTTIGDFLEIKGHDQLRLLVLRLIADINLLYELPGRSDALVRSFSSLGAQWLYLGYSGKAGMAFDKAKEYCRSGGVSSTTTIQLHLLSSQYLFDIRNLDKCEEQVTAARSLFLQRKDIESTSRKPRSLQDKTQAYELAAKAYTISAHLALERGAAQLALNHAKSAVRLLRRAWAYVESQTCDFDSTTDASRLDSSQNVLVEDLSSMSLVNEDATISTQTSQSGPLFWPLITPLYAALNFVARIYAHNGLYLETHYYQQEAYKLASTIGSQNHIANSSALIGSTYLQAGMLDKGSEHLGIVTGQFGQVVEGRSKALLDFNVGIMHGKLGDHAAEIEAYDAAHKLLDKLANSTYIQHLDQLDDASDPLVKEMAQLAITKPKKGVPKKAPIVRTKKAPVKKVATPAASVTETKSSVTEQCPLLIADQGMILRQKARTLTSLKRLEAADNVLQGIDHMANCQASIIDQKITVAKHILQQSMEQMAIDPVYSVLQDSTLSYPAVSTSSKSEKAGDRLSVIKASPPKKPLKNSRTRGRSKSPMPDSFFDRLRQAQEHLMDVHSLASAAGSISTVHHVAVLLNSVTMLLSAFGHGKAKLLAHPGFASCSIETGRNLALRRERRVIQAECDIPNVVDSNSWPSPRAIDARRSSISFLNDNIRFQQTYVDIIPKAWTTISIALSDSRDELSITKFEAGHSPFVLRLPLGRHNSMDADEEVFGFEQGQSELLEIVQLANESAHDARDMNTREARESWWEEREALDARLRDLLENIEKVWLGGFTGIFSQHARRTDLLARFQKSFQNILDRHLPSRRKAGKKASAQRITLDSRILELFIGLGDASDEDCDFSEPLADLLNFVVDVLQFHGEQNEYAEIDFDTIVIETQDALRGYHTAVNSSGQSPVGQHTLLILDKALHSFPWESLPCMQGQAVSRLPSLSALRERILQQQIDIPDGARPGQYIHRQSGQYILNPSGDLKSTQTMFAKSLQGLMWDGLVRQVPKEEEIKTALTKKDLYLYFGHGSGAQYIRAKEIRRLEKCAVTWLMGCSSGALVNAGEFEPYGPAMNYMHAGCPALVATLWDVTDKDIDRFAKSAFEHWGLFEKENVVKGKGRKKLDVVVEEEGERLSLVEAVSKGKEACNLRYLNAAAVCVYGIPVYFK